MPKVDRMFAFLTRVGMKGCSRGPYPTTWRGVDRVLPDDARDDHVVTPAEEAIVRDRLRTFDEDLATARPAEEVLQELHDELRCAMTNPNTIPDYDAGELPITPEEERILEERERTLEEDEKTARPAAEVIEELRRKHRG
jgi:hypothetical protein